MGQQHMTQRRSSIVVALVFLLTSLPAAMADSGNQLPVGLFSQAQPGTTFPAGWKPLTFDKIPIHTQYDLVTDGETVVVKAVSQQSSSGLTREITIDPEEYPVVQWRWKVENVLKHGDVRSAASDIDQHHADFLFVGVQNRK